MIPTKRKRSKTNPNETHTKKKKPSYKFIQITSCWMCYGKANNLDGWALVVRLCFDKLIWCFFFSKSQTIWRTNACVSVAVRVAGLCHVRTVRIFLSLFVLIRDWCALWGPSTQKKNVPSCKLNDSSTEESLKYCGPTRMSHQQHSKRFWGNVNFSHIRAAFFPLLRQKKSRSKKNRTIWTTVYIVSFQFTVCYFSCQVIYVSIFVYARIFCLFCLWLWSDFKIYLDRRTFAFIYTRKLAVATNHFSLVACFNRLQLNKQTARLHSIAASMPTYQLPNPKPITSFTNSLCPMHIFC